MIGCVRFKLKIMNKNTFLTLLLLVVIGGGAYYIGLLQGQLKDQIPDEEIVADETESMGELEEMNKDDAEEETLPEYMAGQVVTVNRYSAIKCSEFADSCPAGLSAELDVRLTEDSAPDKLTGEFFVKVYQNGTLVATKMLSQDWNPFGGDGGGVPMNDGSSVMTISGNVKQKFSLTPNLRDEYSEYFLNLKNDGGVSDMDGRWIDFGYSGGKVDISFIQ